MDKISRNEKCPCGSGLKYKRCCGVQKTAAPKPPPLEGLVPGIRMKGGVRPHLTKAGFIAIVHTWDNVECRGEPKEWQSPQLFSTEDEAMEYYKRNIRPALEQLMSGLAKEVAGVRSFHRRLE